MTEAKRIHGAGGSLGGGGNQVTNVTVENPVYTPTYTDDDPALQSTSFAQMQFLLCEGEVSGPAEGLDRAGLEKSVYLDDTPIRVGGLVTPQPEDLVFSFGRSAAAQSGVPGFSHISQSYSVDTQVKYGLPVSKSVTGTVEAAIYRARVLLTFQALVHQRANGDVVAMDVGVEIRLTDGNNYESTVVFENVSGKFSGQFQREYEFDLTGPGPWRITVIRNTYDDDERNSKDDTYNSAFNFSTVIMSLDERLSYPYSSMLTLGIKADQYSSLPTVSVDMNGLILYVPSNYDPSSRTYSGIWNGTFKRAFSNNPAWVLYDLLINNRYGLGDLVDTAQLDKWSLYEVARYCDEMVPSAEGGYEPRFTCNIVLQTSEQAYSVLQQLASIFRGLLYYASGTIVAIQDRKKTPVFTFNESNTIEEFDADGKVSQGNFTYAGVAQRARHTVVLASWDDPLDNYQPRVEYVADDDALARLGYRAMDLRLMGVTSRGQALRAANWALLSETLLSETVAFKSNEIGSAIRPGDLVLSADPGKAARRYGGRIADVAGDVITLDDTPTAPAAGWAGTTFSYMTANANGEPELVNRQVVSIVGDVVTLVADPIAATPVKTFPWLIETSDRSAQKFRILTVEEQEEGVYSFTALRYREDIYDAVDFNTPLNDNEDYLYKPVNPDPPVITTAQVIWDNNQAKLDVVWLPADTNAALNGFDLSVKEYRFQYQAGSVEPDGSITWDGVWREIARQNDTREQIPIDQFVASDRFKVRIAAVSRLGVQSGWAEKEADDITVWFPMPDLGATSATPPAKNGVLTHMNQSTGSQLFSWLFNTPLPPYVNGVRLEGKPSRDLDPRESIGLIPPDADGWYAIGDKAIDDYYAVAFHALVGWDVRMSLTTAIPGLKGDTYAYDVVDVAEIQPPTPLNFRVVHEGGAQSRVGQKRFSWELPDPSPFAEKWPLNKITDISVFEVRYRQGTMPDWDRGFSLFSDGIPGDQLWFETNLFDYGEWCIMLRAVDATGWESADYAVVTIGIGEPLPTNVVERIDLRDQGFPGDVYNFERVGVSGGPLYETPLTDPIYKTPLDDQFYEGYSGFELKQIDATQQSVWITDVNVSWKSPQLVIHTKADATYRWFIRKLSDGSDLMYPPPLTDLFYASEVTGIKITDLGDDVITDASDYILMDYVGGLDSLMYYPGQATGALGWHPYAPNEELSAGAYQFKLEMISLDGTTQGTVSDADAVFDYPDVLWQAEDLAVPAAGTRVTFPAGTFLHLKAVSLTVQDNSFAPGVATNAVISFKSKDYVDIRAIDASGNPVDGVIDVFAVGY